MVKHTAVIPGEGIGNSIKLGQQMYTIVNKFVKFNHKINIAYSDKNYMRTPIIVTLHELGIRLLFENSTQRLILIEIIDLKYLKLFYNGMNLNDIIVNSSQDHCDEDDTVKMVEGMNAPSIAKDMAEYNLEDLEEVTLVYPTLRDIYNKIFGPTYPGKLSGNCLIYILSYPGISFRFSITSSGLKAQLQEMEKNDDSVLSKLLNWEKPNNIRCEAISIFEGTSWNEFHSRLSNEPPKLRSPSEKSVEMLAINLKLGLIKILFNNKQERFIKIGKTTQQEMLSILGPPDDYFNKFDSRLLIHKHLSKSLELDSDYQDNSIYKFHNYFKLGLDFLYDLNDKSSLGSTGILKKVIVHNGGITESLDFMKWNKCNWTMIPGNNSSPDNEFPNDITIDSSMYFDEIPQQFFDAINTQGKEVIPVLLNRNETEFVDNDLDIIDTSEVSSVKETIFKQRSNSIKSVSSNTKTKTWGQSKLYGCNRCIWEVIDSLGCVSSLTIY